MMLPLPTEATIKVMNISIDRCNPSHIYNDYNLFRQFRFTQQSVAVNTDDEQRNMEISNGNGSLRRWRLCYYSNERLIPLYCSTSKLSCFLAVFSSPGIIKTNFSLAREVVQKYVNRWTGIIKSLWY